MKLLLLADKESPYFWDYYQPGRLREYDLMLSCGDLKAEYLSFLATLGRAPLYYVRGNHDGNYDRRPPEGCDCIEDKLIIFNGLRIAGLGGSRLYSGGKDQYSEREMKNRIWKLGWQIRRAGGVDIVLAHAPVRGFGDGDDYAHMGFEAFCRCSTGISPAISSTAMCTWNMAAISPACSGAGTRRSSTPMSAIRWRYNIWNIQRSACGAARKAAF